jgi:hypothetical protein
MEPFNVVNFKYSLENDKEIESMLKLYDYTEKSIVLECDENFGKSFSDELKVDGKYNTKLKIGKGWVFPKSKYGNLQQLIANIIDKSIKGKIPYDYNKVDYTVISGPLGSLPAPEPSIVSDFKKILNNLNNKNFEMYVNGSRIYLWGEKDSVQNELNGMSRGTDIKNKIETETHMFVVL